MTSFAQIQKLPEQQRAAYGHPVLTVRWWDREEILALTKQSWFGTLRSDLSTGGKVTLNLGVFKFEQGGVAHELSQAELIKTVADLLERIEPMTSDEFQKALNRSVATSRFESQLVVLQGEFRSRLSVRKSVELMLAHVADYIGVETRTRERSRVIKRSELEVLQLQLKAIYDNTGGSAEIGNAWHADPDNLERERIRGVDMIVAGLDMNSPNGAIKALACPVEAVRAFPHPGGFGARILGWTEHVGNYLLVWVIAMASVNYFKEEEISST